MEEFVFNYYETLTLNMLPMNVFFSKLRSDKKSVLWEPFTDLLAKNLMNLSLPSNFNPYLTLLLADYKTKNSYKWHPTAATEGTQL